MNFDPQPFNVLLGLGHWAIVFGIVAALTALIGLLVSLVTNKSRVFVAFGSQIKRLFRESYDIAPRRIWALTMLTFREAIRRKALAVFLLFAIVFMFAGWFLSNTDGRPAMQVRLHVSFVLTAITFLILPVVLLLSCWGLPEDIKARSLHTVVTKPVRRHEIYLGRFFGFSMIGTLVLVLMSVVGYIWITRQVPPDAQSELVCRNPVYGHLSFLDPNKRMREKGINVGDIWEFRSFIPGDIDVAAVWTFHDVTPERMGDTVQIESRFEVFRTNKGDQKRGVNCEYRFVKDLRAQTARAIASARGFEKLEEQIKDSNFQGGDTPGASTTLLSIADRIDKRLIKMPDSWFRGIETGYRDFAELLQPFLETEEDTDWIEEFIQQARLCSQAAGKKVSAELVEPLRAIAAIFAAHHAELKTMLVDIEARQRSRRLLEVPEFGENLMVTVDPDDIDYTVNGGSQRIKGNLYKDVVHGGVLNVHVNCVDSGQYMGMARPDLFLRLPDRPFWVGFAKSIFGIWLLMLLVITLGVTGSCFLKGPVATLLTFVLVILGSSFHDFLEKVVTGKVDSAGTFESAYRIINHQNPRSEISGAFESGFAKFGYGTMQNLDAGLRYGLWVIHKIVPNFANYQVSPYVSNGFDVPWDSALLPALLTTLGFLIPCLLLGYLSLALRELEDK